jgi:hypothetical protein
MVRRGSTVRVRQRALQRPRKTGSFVFGPAYTPPARSGVESVLEKRVLRRIPAAASWSVPLKIELCSTALRNGPAALERPGPGTGKELRCKESVCEASQRSRSRSTCFEPRASHSTRTVAAMLAVGSKPGGSFKRVENATYTLADDLAESASATPKKPEAKARPKRPSGNARKRTSRNAQTAA